MLCITLSMFVFFVDMQALDRALATLVRLGTTSTISFPAVAICKDCGNKLTRAMMTIIHPAAVIPKLEGPKGAFLNTI